MAGISSKATKGNDYSPNKKKYNGIEETREFELNQYDAFYRILDPQIGRWWQIDPMIENQEDVSPYSSMANDPILKSDALGDEPEELESGPVPQALTLGKRLYSAYRLYQAGQSLSKATMDISLGEVIETLMPFGQGGQIQLKETKKESLPVEVTPVGVDKLKDALGPFVHKIEKTKEETQANTTTKKDRVVNQKSGEKAQNQLEGIEKKQAKAKKDASSQSEKQNRINSIKKSKQKLDKELNDIKSLRDAINNW